MVNVAVPVVDIPPPVSTEAMVMLNVPAVGTARISKGLSVKSDAEYPVLDKLETAEIVTKSPTDAPCAAHVHVTVALLVVEVKAPTVVMAAALPLVPFDWGVSSFIVPFVASKI